MRVSIPGPDSVETPVTGVGLVALPTIVTAYCASSRRRARTPRPPTARAREPVRRVPRPVHHVLGDDLSGSASSAIRSRPRRRSSTRCPATRRPTPAPRRIRPAHRLAVGRPGTRGTRARELDRARREFVTRSDTLRLRMRQWEDSTYQGYDSIVRGLRSTGRPRAVTDTTGADGWAHLKLAPGRWWVYARSWDATDPNAEWYWNLPVDRGHPAAVEPQRRGGSRDIRDRSTMNVCCHPSLRSGYSAVDAGITRFKHSKAH